jgi:hypothetical protein
LRSLSSKEWNLSKECASQAKTLYRLIQSPIAETKKNNNSLLTISIVPMRKGIIWEN